MLLVSAYIPEWSLLVSANISVQSSIAHVLLPLLFVADKNPSQGAATTITAVCFDPSFDTEQQRSEVLPYPRLLSDHRSIPMSCVRMRVRLFAISHGNWVVRRKSRWNYRSDRILCLWCSPLKGMDGWMDGDEWIMNGWRWWVVGGGDCG